ncbi:YheC/YheD family protein [Oceanobacillus kapialis]|uniref:YheC/YheD family protein n=1 Tax=Oceanobacillus kapialis TaxID=481353 RepID=A0ABW5Q050_9BACI
MDICYMRNYKQPAKFVTLLSKAAKYYGIRIVYCQPADVNMAQKTVTGKVLINNEWVKKEVPLPYYIDLNTYCFRFKEIITFLKEHCFLLSKGSYGTKNTVYKRLEKDGKFKHLLIPTLDISSYSEFLSALTVYNKLILKPRKGHKGQGIYLISYSDEKYVITENDRETVVNLQQLEQFFIKNIHSKQYLFQKYIDSKTIFGHPFNCRVRLEKNGQGNWQVAIFLVRIGSYNKVVSNIAQGGSISKLTPFLKANYPRNWKEINSSIQEVANTLPDKIEEIFNKQNTSMGLDLGIDKEGKIYLYEVNSAPGSQFAEGEIANLKADYYFYLLKLNA